MKTQTHEASQGSSIAQSTKQRVREFLEKAVILTVLACLITPFGDSVLAAEIEFCQDEHRTVALLTNKSGEDVTGLRIELQGDLELDACVGVGCDMQVVANADGILELSGFCVPNGTLCLEWLSDDVTLVRAAWLIEDEEVWQIDLHTPIARFLLLGDKVVGEPVRVEALGSKDSDGEQLLQYEWFWNDGVTAQGYSTSRTFTAPGTFRITLVVTDAKGLQDSQTAVCRIGEQPIPEEPEIDVLYQLAFCKDGILYIINEDGTGLTPIVTDMPLWYAKAGPGYEGILFVSSAEGGGLFIVQLDGSNVTKLSSGTTGALSWNIPGLIVYGRYGEISNLHTVNPDGTNYVQITNDNAWYRALVSPNGLTLLCHRGDRTTWLMDVDGANQRQIGAFKSSSPVWRPDGNEIMAYTMSTTEMVAIDPETLEQTVIMTADELGGIGFVSAVNYTHDGSKIAFTLKHGSGERDAWIMNSDGSNPVQITAMPGEEYAGQWSPNGDSLIVIRGDYDKDFYIYDVESGQLADVPLAEGASHKDRMRWFGHEYCSW